MILVGLQQNIRERIEEIITKERENNLHKHYNVVQNGIRWNGYAYVLVLQLQGKTNIDNIKHYKEVVL